MPTLDLKANLGLQTYMLSTFTEADCSQNTLQDQVVSPKMHIRRLAVRKRVSTFRFEERAA